MIKNWDQIEKSFKQAHLLLGNGFSANISRQFSYPQLKAASEFSREIHALFKLRKIDTDNFEEVLLKLAIAKEALSILGGSKRSIETIQSAYDEIRGGLYDAISAVHCTKQNFLNANADHLPDIRKHLLSYESIFTTNYDLILPWIILSESGGAGFADYFYSNPFDPDDTEIWDGKVPIYYLHGALFLSSNTARETSKLGNVAGFYSNIAKIKQRIIQNDNYPLIITEGDWIDKKRSIRMNDYLTFCLSELRSSGNKFVIFGQDLSETQDKHILDAINKKRNRIAVSIYKGRKEKNRLNIEVAQFKEKLNLVSDLQFFYSDTHPLSRLDKVKSNG